MALWDFLAGTDWSAATPVDFADMMPYEIGRNVLLPFIFVFIIFWAILEKMGIFNKRINVVLSLGVSILLATTPAFTMMALLITQLSGGSMLLVFGLLMVGGTLAWAFGRGKDIYHEQVSPDRKLGDFDKKIRRAEKKGNMDTAEKLREEKKRWYNNWKRRNRY